MDIAKIQTFFKWCTIINGVLLVYTFFMCLLFPDLVYGIQGKLFQISRESFNEVVYLFIALFKLLWLVFNVTPCIALYIVTKKTA